MAGGASATLRLPSCVLPFAYSCARCIGREGPKPRFASVFGPRPASRDCRGSGARLRPASPCWEGVMVLML